MKASNKSQISHNNGQILSFGPNKGTDQANDRTRSFNQFDANKIQNYEEEKADSSDFEADLEAFLNDDSDSELFDSDSNDQG